MLAIAFVSLLPAGVIVAALRDLQSFKVPNWVHPFLIAGYLAAALAAQTPVAIVGEGLLLGLAGLALGFGLFAFKVLGAGDAKLLASVAPWVGLEAAPDFLLYTALAGGALSVLLIGFRSLPLFPVYAQAPWLMRMHERRKDAPYAVAIAVGALAVFPETPVFTGALL